MRRWLQLGLIDFLVALVLLPPGSILAFQAALAAGELDPMEYSRRRGRPQPLA